MNAAWVVENITGGEDTQTSSASPYAQVLALALEPTTSASASAHYEPPGETFTT